MNWQDDVARDDKTNGSPEEDVAGKMIAGGDTGKADGNSQAVGDEGDPAMLAIPVGEHSGYGVAAMAWFEKNPPEWKGLWEPLKKLSV
jgi:hypothetical protein